jgi:hypothetical protein
MKMRFLLLRVGYQVCKPPQIQGQSRGLEEGSSSYQYASRETLRGQRVMDKGVQEVTFKFFMTHLDSLMDDQYFLHEIEVEGAIPPETVDVNIEEYMLPLKFRGKVTEGKHSFSCRSVVRARPETHVEKYYLLLQ